MNPCVVHAFAAFVIGGVCMGVHLVCRGWRPKE